MYTQELGAAHSLHGRTIDGQRSMLGVHSPEVNDNLLRLLHIQREIVVTMASSVERLDLYACMILYMSLYYNPKSEKVVTVWKTQIKKESSDF